MEISVFIQMLSGYTGLIASLFFAFGMVIQNIRTMLDMSTSYFGPNPSTVSNLSNQKADYIIGFTGLFFTFALQITSYLIPNFTKTKINLSTIEAAAYMAFAFTIIFFLLRLLAKYLAKKYEIEINSLFKKLEAERLGKGS